MASVFLSAVATADLNELLVTRSLPLDARARVRERLRQLEGFPESGVALEGRWAPARALVGPWSWMLHVYDYDRSVDRVTVLTIHDTRTSTAP